MRVLNAHAKTERGGVKSYPPPPSLFTVKSAMLASDQLKQL